MTLQFGRNVRITFGEYGKEGIQSTGLRVSFSVQKTKKKEVNSAQIQIYNLTQENRKSLSGNNIFFQIEVKWDAEEVWSILASGDVLDVSSQQNGADIITSVTIADGIKDVRDTAFNKSYPKGTKFSSVLTDILGTFKNIDVQDAKNFVSKAISNSKEFLTGSTISGRSFDELDKILTPLGLNASVTDNQLIIDKKFETSQTEAFLLKSDSGLLGSPQEKTFTLNKEEKKGISISTLLNPRINIGSIVKIKSKQIDGEYVVFSLTHAGDSIEGSWLTTAECLERL